MYGGVIGWWHGGAGGSWAPYDVIMVFVEGIGRRARRVWRLPVVALEGTASTLDPHQLGHPRLPLHRCAGATLAWTKGMFPMGGGAGLSSLPFLHAAD